jgi:hypothetical protein
MHHKALRLMTFIPAGPLLPAVSVILPSAGGLCTDENYTFVNEFACAPACNLQYCHALAFA